MSAAPPRYTHVVSRRPDFVPPMWSQGPLNRWVQGDTRRVIVWFTCAPLIALLLALGLVLAGSWVGWLVAVAAALLVAQAAVYLPRALDARRRPQR